MLAFSWSYCAVPSLGNGGAPCWDAYWALAWARIWSNCCCVTVAPPIEAMAPAGTLLPPQAANTSADASRPIRTAAKMTVFVIAHSRGYRTGRETHVCEV